MLRIHLRHELRRESVQGTFAKPAAVVSPASINRQSRPPLMEEVISRIGPSSAVVSHRGPVVGRVGNACEFKRCVICHQNLPDSDKYGPCPLPSSMEEISTSPESSFGKRARWSRRSWHCPFLPSTVWAFRSAILLANALMSLIPLPIWLSARDAAPRAATRPGSTVSSTRRLWSEGTVREVGSAGLVATSCQALREIVQPRSNTLVVRDR